MEASANPGRAFFLVIGKHNPATIQGEVQIQGWIGMERYRTFEHGDGGEFREIAPEHQEDIAVQAQLAAVARQADEVVCGRNPALRLQALPAALAAGTLKQDGGNR